MSREDPLVHRATAFAALGEPHRLAIVDALALSDRSPSDLAEALHIESNLLAHHIQALVDAGLVERVVSGGDHRRRYLHLRWEALDGLLRPAPVEVSGILFVCTQNSARSQFAAALWEKTSRIPGWSAATHPAPRVHPMAVRVARDHGLDLASAVPRSLADVLVAPRLVVTVCDRANEELPDLGTERLHWSIPDPSEVGTMDAFRNAFELVQERVALLASNVAPEDRP